MCIIVEGWRGREELGKERLRQKKNHFVERGEENEQESENIKNGQK